MDTPHVEAIFHQETPPKKKKRYLTFRLIVLTMLLGMIATITVFVITVLSDLPPLTAIENPKTDLSTQIYTADGKLIRSLYSEEHRISVKLNEISPNVLDALIAAEDIRFHTHSGVDPKSFFAIAKDVMKGKKPRGGSTISMQLARNLYDQIGRKRSMLRKLKEMVVAIILERKFTKEEIITAYLNTVSFVGNTYGIQNAARHYYRKDAKDLDKQEAAMLVGLLKGTNDYNPRKKPEAAMKRRNTVLDQMLKYDMITDVEADTLKAKPLDIKDPMDIRDLGTAAYFTEHLRLWLKEWCRDHGYNLYTDGLKVYTTLDSRMQEYAEQSVTDHFNNLQPIFDKHVKRRNPWKKDTMIIRRAMTRSARYNMLKREGKSLGEIEKIFKTERKMQIFSWKGVIDTVMTPWDSLKYYSKFLETGFVAIDPSNGFIKAWVGGIDHRFFKYDHVAEGRRQVGSTFKPFVYTAAFDNGMTPCDQELNQPVFFYNNKGDEIWAPKNADGKIGGFMTLRRGLATSTNLITARVMKRIKPEIVCKWAYRMGIQSTLDCVPSLALGTTDLQVLELTGAYCTFVNKGVWNEPVFVTRIEDKNGNIIQDFKGESRQAIREETAYMMLNMLQGVVNEPGGTGGRLRFKYKLRNPMGGKTGTTQNHSDGWFMGVTPYLVAGTWVGCADRKMRFSTLTYGQGASLALPIFAGFMKRVYADTAIGLPKDDFAKPRNFNIELDCAKYELKNGKPTREDSLFFMGKKSVKMDDEDYEF